MPSGQTTSRATRRPGRKRPAEPAGAVRRAADSTAVEVLGRVGFAAYGLVHVLLAWLVVQVAFGRAGGEADSSGALQTIASGPGGKALLWVIAVTLFGLALWQVAEALVGHEAADESDNTKRRAKKALYVARAVVYGLIGFSAARIAAGGSSSQREQGSTLTGQVLAWPGGQVLVALVGAGIVVGAAVLVHRGLAKKFLRHLDLSGAGRTARTAATRSGQAGYAALGVSYGILGVLVIVGAVTYDPEKAGGLDTALKTLSAQPFGTVLLVVVAAGLLCYGIYCGFQSRFRRG